MRNTHEKYANFQDEGSLWLLVTVWVYRILLLLVMLAWISKIGATLLPSFTGVGAIVLGAYWALLIIMQGIYRACAIGQARVSELVMSQLLATGISAGLIYSGVALYMHRFFNPVPLLFVVAIQSLIGVVWSLLVNRSYFQRRRKPATAIIYCSEAELQTLYQSPYFHEKYDVIKLIHQPQDDIVSLQKQLEGCEVVFTIGIPAALTNGIAKLCVEADMKGYFTPRLGNIIIAGAEYRSNFSIPMLRVERAGGHSGYRAMKRIFDIVISALGIVILSPIMLLTAIAIKLEDHGPVFYRQVRLTRNAREFNILKFRSMKVNAEEDGIARLAGENDSRITKVGKFIRACRLDELPQLFNILLGDMSVVGPRPERPEIARQYEEKLSEFPLRLQVKAGLTGLAQVYGRYNTEPYHKLQMDLMYINDMSLLKDLQLLLATIKILFVKESTQGIVRGQATAMTDHRSEDTTKSA